MSVTAQVLHARKGDVVILKVRNAVPTTARDAIVQRFREQTRLDPEIPIAVLDDGADILVLSGCSMPAPKPDDEAEDIE